MREGGSRMRRIAAIVLVVWLLDPAGHGAQAQTEAEVVDKLDRLELMVQTLLERDAEKDRLIEQLRREVSALRSGSRGRLADELVPSPVAGWGAAPPLPTARPAETQKAETQQAGTDAGAGAGGEQAATVARRVPDLYSIGVGDAVVRLKGIDLASVFTVGASTADDADTLGELQGGDHDPSGNGFTLQTANLHFHGAVDPYFDAKMTLSGRIESTGNGDFNFDEVYLRTKDQHGFRVRLGDFVTDFGAFNRLETDDWRWADMPVAVSRLLGQDHMHGLGTELTWSSGDRSPLTLSVAVQNATGDGMASFLSSSEVFGGRPVGGRDYTERDMEDVGDFVYSGRIAKVLDRDRGRYRLGLSAAAGPNASGADEATRLLGADVAYSHRFPGGDQLLLEAEGIYRSYEVPAGDTLQDWGGYVQALTVFDDLWGLGLRLEGATGNGDSAGIYGSRGEDPWRTDRMRVSPMLVYYLAPQLRLRMQYNLDKSDHLDSREHSVWGSVVYSFGAGASGIGEND